MFKFIVLLLLALVPLTSHAKDYTIGVGDKLNISVAGEPDFLSDTMVRPDGNISVRNCCDVPAVGQTIEQLQAAVTTKLKEYMRNPVVSVSVQGMGNSAIYVMGGGVKPMTVDASRHATLLNLMTGLGDISAVDLRNASVVRDGQEIKKDFHDLIVGSDTSQDIPLMAGDTILLPPTASNRGVYVVGAVNAPKVVMYREGLTVLEAILDAGGYSKFASPNDTRIVRHENGQEQVIKVKGKKLVRDGDMKQNAVLRGGDLIIVEESFF